MYNQVKYLGQDDRVDKHNPSFPDSLDIKILSILSEDARTSYRAIAKKMHVAPGTIYNRIKKMSNDGIIKGYITLLDYEKLGYGFTALIFLQVEGKHLIEIEKQLASLQEVVAVYDITGEFDVVVITRFKNMESLNSFVKKILESPYIKRTVTNVILNVVKEDLRIKI